MTLTFHVACDPEGSGGSAEPLVPRVASEVFWYCAPAPPMGIPGNRPPALPQESITGAEPGARQGAQ